MTKAAEPLMQGSAVTLTALPPGEWSGPFSEEDAMYEKPRMQRFGTFRELTQAGITGSCDGYTVTNSTTGVATDGTTWNSTPGRCRS